VNFSGDTYETVTGKTNLSFEPWLTGCVYVFQIFILLIFTYLSLTIYPFFCSTIIIIYLQSNRKRKQPTSSGAANSTGTGNTVGPSTNSPPSTPSTHTPGDGLGMPGNMRHVPKNLVMYGADGTGLASSSNQMDDLEPFGDVGSLEDNVESFLANDDGDARDIFAALKRSPAEPNPAASKGNTLMFSVFCKHEITHLLVFRFYLQ
jgi:hypothetical protein